MGRDVNICSTRLLFMPYFYTFELDSFTQLRTMTAFKSCDSSSYSIGRSLVE